LGLKRKKSGKKGKTIGKRRKIRTYTDELEERTSESIQEETKHHKDFMAKITPENIEDDNNHV